MTIIESIEPLSRKPVAERLTTRMLELIRSGNLRPGDKVPTEHELAAAFQVSRPVVREALRGLSIMGIVESRQGSRCYVTDLAPSRLLAPLQFVIPLDESNAGALFQARIVVEAELLRLGALNVGAKHAERLEALVVAGHQLVTDPVAFRVLDLEFHRLLMQLAGNPFLERIAQSLYELGMEYRRVASETPGVIARSAAEHAAIVDALKARDATAAAEAMRTHLASISATTVDAIRELAAIKARGRDDPACER